MKRFSLTAATLLTVAMLAIAQTSEQQIPPTDSTKAESTTVTEVVEEQQTEISSSTQETQTPIKQFEDISILKDGKTYQIDENSYILKNGRVYELEDLTNDITYHVDRLNSDKKAKLIAIAFFFVVPCVTILLALAFILTFLLRRTQAKNAIIEHAIDANYQLPDAFYQNQSAASNVSYTYANPYPEQPTINSNNEASSERFIPRQVNSHDPKKFKKAITLIGIGLAIFLCFASANNEACAFLFGGIPFFIGIGNLIGYFYIPGYNNETTPMYPNNAPYQQQQQQQQQPSACPPPYNPGQQQQQ